MKTSIPINIVKLGKELENLNTELAKIFTGKISEHKNSIDKRLILVEKTMRGHVGREINSHFLVVLQRVEELTKQVGEYQKTMRNSVLKIEVEFRDKAAMLDHHLKTIEARYFKKAQ